MAYEQNLNGRLAQKPMIILCSYSLELAARPCSLLIILGFVTAGVAGGVV